MKRELKQDGGAHDEVYNIEYNNRILIKNFIIPHPTLANQYLLSYDNTRQNSWVNNHQAIQASHTASIIAPAQRSHLTTTIEGGSSTGDTSFGDSVLKLAITANHTDSEQLHDNYNNRAGGGGVSVSCGGQSPPTPTVGKTLLNTNANLLPITTASDTFNNLKNLVKIDKASPLGGVGNNSSGNGYGRTKANGGGNINNGGGGGYRNNHGGPQTVAYGEGGRGINNHGSNNNGSISNSNPNRIGASASSVTGQSAHFSTGYNKNSAKIRQYDSEVSPRPRRSSSSRYYTKNSDNLGHAGHSGGSTGNGGNTGRTVNLDLTSSSSSGVGGGRSGAPNATSSNNDNVRRGGGYQSTPSDGGYNRNLNAHTGSSGNYRQQQSSRYDNVNGNNTGGQQQQQQQQQQRQYGNGSNNGGYNNFNNKSYNSNRDNVNSRPSHRDHEYGNRDYRDFDDSPHPRSNNRYISGNNGSSSSSSNYNNTNSLERRYKPAVNQATDSTGGSGGSPSLPPSALRQGQNFNENNSSSSAAYERNNYSDKRQYQNQRNSPPLRGGGNGHNSNIGGNGTAHFIKSNSSSRGASPNSSSPSGTLRQSGQGQASQPTSTTPPPSAGRWVPPSLRPQHGLTQSEKNDTVFRKVRGILNKLTPEKFQELSDELLKLDLNSIVILNGVIILIFDKALDEPKYSSMYAQLCKRLSEEAPSFEKDPNTSCTFLRLLIAVCRDKFNNRLKRDELEESLTNIRGNTQQQQQQQQKQKTNGDDDSDEEERRHLVKQRMLGNVKFIGELSKLDMLSKNVLHQCIMELLDKKKKRSAAPQEMCEDMECLAQLLKTCGKNLDSEQGKELMNQYFVKLDRRSKSTDYPPRIRFMLKDVIELRENNWVPRKVATTEGPVPIKQIRTDDDTILRTPFAQQRNRDTRNNDRDNDSWMNRFHLNIQPGFNDMFSGLSVTGASPLVSPFAASNNNRTYNNRERNQNQNYNNNRYNKHNNQNGNSNNGSGAGGHRDHRDDMRGGNGNQHMNRDNNNAANQLNANKELAPRFKRNLITTNQDSVENLVMRPAANSLLFKAASQNQKVPTMLPISTPPSGMGGMGMGGGLGTPFGSGVQSNSREQLSTLPNAQYPLLGTPSSSHLSNPARPSSTPSAEYDIKQAQANHLTVIGGVSMQIEKGLKATSSTPNFGTSINAAGSDLNVADKDGLSLGSGGKLGGAQLLTKHGSIEKPAIVVGNSAGNANALNKQKKDKAFNKDEVLKKCATYIKEKFYYNDDTNDDEDDVKENILPEPSTEEVVGENNVVIVGNNKFRDFMCGFNDLKVPEKCLKDVCINLILDVLEKADEKLLERVVEFLITLRKECGMKPNVVVEIFKQVIYKMNEREALNPRINTHVAILLAKAVGDDAGLLKLNDIANYTDNGQHYPLFLLGLQQLHKLSGKDVLTEKFNASKVDLLNNLPEADRNKVRLAEILDERNLAFLYPLLKVQAEMLKQLTAEPNPAAFYKWIKTNVDAKYYREPGFISALMTVVLKFITNETSLSEGTDIKKHPEKAIIEKEEALLHKYCQILQTFFGQELELQLMAVYALQVFCFNESFPKGMLCRWFKYLYEASVIEEETFITWKEEISDKYPGKGSALFQVNSWLTWLQEAESEDEDE